MEDDVLLHNYFQRIAYTLKCILLKHPIEIVLIVAALIITIVSFAQNSTVESATVEKINDQENFSLSKNKPDIFVTNTDKIFVDVSGAVDKPGVYEASPGARIHDMIQKAGGISHEADAYFVARNFNMSRFVGDQDKIYIPFMFDIALGTFTEAKRNLEYLQPLYPASISQSDSSETLNTNNSNSSVQVSINESSQDELDTLPGIGPVTAGKIIDNRPYVSLDELLTKKVMNQSTFDKIKDFISL